MINNIKNEHTVISLYRSIDPNTLQAQNDPAGTIPKTRPKRGSWASFSLVMVSKINLLPQPPYDGKNLPKLF